MVHELLELLKEDKVVIGECNLSHEEIVEKLKELLVEAVKKTTPDKKFGVMLSGGVDSSLIAFLLKQAGYKFTCYTAGLEGAPDLEFATKFCKQYDLPLRKKVMTLADIEATMSEVTPVIIRPDLVKISVAVPCYAALVMAKEDSVDFLFGGLGSEEIFAGYQRHEKAENINEECLAGLKGMEERDLTRDLPLAEKVGIGLVCPYLELDLVTFSLSIPGEFKIKEGVKKQILREAAESLGLDETFAWRPKKAAQYGSSTIKAFDKLAKQKGLSSKKELIERFIQ